MPYPLRIECKKVASFQTTRARNSELWFVNNPELEHAILGYAARYSTRYEVKLYALAIEGNHVHQVAHFPNANRAHYMRDFNSTVAKAVARYQSSYPGGGLWERRYSAEHLPDNADIEEYFFYSVLQAVNDGLVDRIEDYPGYNCFEDAIKGRSRSYKVVKWKEYNDARRRDPNVLIEDFTEWCTLQYARLPGYERLPQKEYELMMRRKLQQRTAAIIKTRQGRASVGSKKLRLVRPGSIPHRTKKNESLTGRPRVLSVNDRRRAKAKAWYFHINFKYRDSSKRYRSGEVDVVFPKGTYRPPSFTVAFLGSVLSTLEG
jgi:hypothetical protein